MRCPGDRETFASYFGMRLPRQGLKVSYILVHMTARLVPACAPAKFNVGSKRGDVEIDIYIVLGSFDQMLNVIAGYNESNHQLEQVGREPAPWTARYQLRSAWK